MKQKTESNVSAARAVSFRQSIFDPLPGLTPPMLAQYHDRFRRGYLREAAYMWDRIEEIDHKVKTVAPKRRKAVSRHGYEIITNAGMEDDKRALEHKEALEAFYDSLTCTNALDMNERGGVPLLLRQMLDAVGKRYAVHEIVWRSNAKSAIGNRQSAISAELRFVPLWLFENTTGRLRYLETDYALSGLDLEDGGWMITVGEGIMAATAVCYMYKRMPLRDWLVYCSRLGGIHGKTAAAAGSEAWTNMEEAVQNLGLDLSIVTDNQSDIVPVNVSASGELPYGPLVERMDRAIVSLWRGGDLSTMSGAGPDSTGASVQGDEQDVLEQDDAELLTDTLNDQLDRLVIRYMFDEEPLAWIKIKTGEKKDVKQDLLVDQGLSGLGFPLTQEALANRYNRPLPQADETILQPRAQSVPPGGPGSTPAVFPQGNEYSRISETAATAQTRLVAAATEALAQAQARDLAPLAERLRGCLELEDPALLTVALRQLQADLPQLARELLRDPVAAKTLEDTLSAALVNGWTEGIAERGTGNAARQANDHWITVNGEHFQVPDDGSNPHSETEQAAEIGRGKAAMRTVLADKSDAMHAVTRGDIGPVHFYWGKPGDPNRDFRHGSGISHIVAKHGEEVALQVSEVIVRGKMGTSYQNGQKRNISHGPYTATIALVKDGRQEHWVLTAFDKREEKR